MEISSLLNPLEQACDNQIKVETVRAHDTKLTTNIRNGNKDNKARVNLTKEAAKQLLQPVLIPTWHVEQIFQMMWILLPGTKAHENIEEDVVVVQNMSRPIRITVMKKLMWRLT